MTGQLLEECLVGGYGDLQPNAREAKVEQRGRLAQDWGWGWGLGLGLGFGLGLGLGLVGFA